MFWAAFDLSMRVIPLKDALGLEKIDFCAFQKIITQVPKNQIFPILMQLLMVPLSLSYQMLPKTIDPPT